MSLKFNLTQHLHIIKKMSWKVFSFFYILLLVFISNTTKLMKHYFLIFLQTIVDRHMKYNEAKQIIQSESYLTGADNSIIRRKGDFVETFKDRNVHNQFQKGDIAYEAMGLFTREKVDRYCMVQQNK
jgi:hypothetical protein